MSSRRIRFVAVVATLLLASVGGAASPAGVSSAIASGELVYVGPLGVPWAAKLDGTGAHRLVPVVAGESWGPPSWSRDGNLIVAVRKSSADPAGKARILVMDPVGAAVASYLVPLSYSSCSATSCVSGFSPDASQIAYGSGAGLRILRRSTGSTNLVPNTVASSDWPAWAPGGSLIAYYDGGSSPRVSVIQPDGSNRRVLRQESLHTHPEGYQYTLRWGPPEWTPPGKLLLPVLRIRWCNGCITSYELIELVDPATPAGGFWTERWNSFNAATRVALTPNSKTLVVQIPNPLLAKTAYPPAPPPGETNITPASLGAEGTAPDVSRAPSRAPLTPNDSIFFFKPGQAMTGTLVNGIYTQRSTFAANGWTAAAASRDSLALYNRNTGALRTGTFRNGVFTVKKNLTLATGFTQIAATCDSLVLYNGANGKAVVATLRKGLLGTTPRNHTFAAGNPKLVTTCDTLQIDFGNASTRVGLLTQGNWTRLAGSGAAPTGALMTGTADSYVRIASRSGGAGSWGTLYAGHATHVNQANSFSAWTKIAGTATSVLFYNGSITATTTLVGGVYDGGGPGPNIGAGWTIIAGGR